MKQTNKREPLSRERILIAALALADREGLEAISMRRIADDLGVEAMSLYNHVANKAAILDGLVEAVLAELGPAAEVSSWKSALRERSMALRAVLAKHPAVLMVFATRAAVTQASIAHVESTLGVLHGAGFSTSDALSALHVLRAYVVGHCLASFATRPRDELSVPAYASLAEEKFFFVRKTAAILATHDVEREFELGLKALLRGLGKLRVPKV